MHKYARNIVRIKHEEIEGGTKMCLAAFLSLLIISVLHLYHPIIFQFVSVG